MFFLAVVIISALQNIHFFLTNKRKDYSFADKRILSTLFVLEILFFLIIAFKFPIFIGILSLGCVLGYTILFVEYLKTNIFVMEKSDHFKLAIRILETFVFISIIIHYLN